MRGNSAEQVSPRTEAVRRALRHVDRLDALADHSAWPGSTAQTHYRGRVARMESGLKEVVLGIVRSRLARLVPLLATESANSKAGLVQLLIRNAFPDFRRKIRIGTICLTPDVRSVTEYFEWNAGVQPAEIVDIVGQIASQQHPVIQRQAWL